MNQTRVSIIERKEIAKDVFEVSFGLDGEAFHFHAGQYVRVTLPHLLYPDTRGDFREFSICSSPSNKASFSIAFRSSESGFKRTLLELPIGSEVMIRGPYGLLEFPEHLGQNQDVVLVTGGIGITPFMSMIRFAAENRLSNRITLLYANDDDRAIPYLTELSELELLNPRFMVRRKKGGINEGFLREATSDPRKALWYVSGPSGMVSDVCDILRRFGVSDTAIVSEEMTGYENQNSEELEQVSVEQRDVESEEGIVRCLPGFDDCQQGDQETSFLGADKLFSIIETSFEGVVITDPEGIILYVNPAWQQLTGWKSKEVVGKVTPRILKSGKTPAKDYETLWKTIRRGEMVHLEVINKKKNGDLYYAEDIILPLRDDHGEITEFVGFQRDISERQSYLRQLTDRSEELAKQNQFLEDTKRAMLNLLEDAQQLERSLEVEKMAIEREKEKSEAILQFLKSIGDGVFAVDLDAKIIFMNKTAEELSGYSFEDANGKSYGDVFHFVLEKDPKASYDRFIEQVMKTGTVGKLPSRTLIVRRDGTTIPVSDSAAPIRDASGAIVGAIVVFQDDTKKRELDQLKESFISVAAHQLRTPLGSMRWSMELLLSGDVGRVPKLAREEINRLYENSQRMITLVNDLLNTSRIDNVSSKPELRPEDIAPLLREVVANVADEAKQRSVIIDLVLGEDPISNVMIVRKNIFEALQNLVVNAVRYSDAGDSVTVWAKQIDGYVRVSVADTGIGIPKDQQSKLFSKFFRASNAVLKETDGSGLGLSVAKMFVEESGGNIRFESEEGQGTTFFVELPLAG